MTDWPITLYSPEELSLFPAFKAHKTTTTTKIPFDKVS